MKQTFIRTTFYGACGLVVLAACAGLHGTMTTPELPCEIAFNGRTLEVTRIRHDVARATALCAFVDTPVAIGTLDLEPDDFIRYPEFRRVKEERAWWDRQRRLYEQLQARDSVTLWFRDSNGEKHAAELPISRASLGETAFRSGLVYLTVLVYLGFAWMVHHRSDDLVDLLCSFLFVSTALYLSCAAPVAQRNFTLPPTLFHGLVNGTYVGAAGLITLVHLSWVFPERIGWIRRFPFCVRILYAYFGSTVGLYLLGLISFGATFPFLVMWSSIMVGAFVYSAARQGTPVLRRMLGMSMLAPVLLGVLFVFLTVLPGVLRMWALSFSSLALFSTVLPFSLTFSTVAHRMYREQELRARCLQAERTALARELHDHVCNDLTAIRFLAGSASEEESPALSATAKLLTRIGEVALSSYGRVRTFVWAMDPAETTWLDFIVTLKKHVASVLAETAIHWQTEIAPAWAEQKIRPALRFQLFAIFKETIGNVMKHARATDVEIRLELDGTGFRMTVRDNGKGFDPAGVPAARLGLRNMADRAHSVGGTIDVETGPEKGTTVHLSIPRHQVQEPAKIPDAGDELRTGH